MVTAHRIEFDEWIDPAECVSETCSIQYFYSFPDNCIMIRGHTVNVQLAKGSRVISVIIRLNANLKLKNRS